MKAKKIPMRKCVSCGEQKEKKELLRIVNNKEEGKIMSVFSVSFCFCPISKRFEGLSIIFSGKLL